MFEELWAFERVRWQRVAMVGRPAKMIARTESLQRAVDPVNEIVIINIIGNHLIAAGVD